MQSSPQVNSTLPNPTFQNSTNQINNGENNVQKKTPKEKTPMCQVSHQSILWCDFGQPNSNLFKCILGQRNREIQQTSTQICTGWRRRPSTP